MSVLLSLVREIKSILPKIRERDQIKIKIKIEIEIESWAHVHSKPGTIIFRTERKNIVAFYDLNSPIDVRMEHRKNVTDG